MEHSMAVYVEVRTRVREHCGKTPKTCWIARCKEVAGLPVKPETNRQDDLRDLKCPENIQPAAFAAYRRLEMK